MTKWKLFLLIFSVFIAGVTHAQMSISLSVSNKTIGSQDALSASYSFKNFPNQQNLPTPDFNDWNVQGTSSSSSVSIINGHATSSKQITFTLLPKHTGTLTVPGTTITINGNKIHCAAASVTVKKKAHLSTAQNNQNNNNLPQMPNLSSLFDDLAPQPAPPVAPRVIIHKNQSLKEASKNKFFIRTLPSKTICYIGEPILVDYQFLSNINCTWRLEKVPSSGSFSVADIAQPNYQFIAKVNGQNYRAQSIRKIQITPLKTGELYLDSCSVSNQFSYLDAQTGEVKTGNLLLKSTPKHITVLPLPTNKPQNFSGAIGQFKISATVDYIEEPAQQNNNLHIEIYGNGNLDDVSLPNINWPSNIQAYDSKDSQSVDKSQFPMPRTLNFDIPFIGNKEGVATIPSIKFNFFNPQTKLFQTISTDSITIKFSKPLNKPAQPIVSNIGNGKYLWIVAGIGLIILLIFGSGWYLHKRKKQPNSEGTVNADKVEETSNTTISSEVEVAQPSKEALFQEKKKQLQEGLLDLELATDAHHFFVLAKALAIQYMQDKLHLETNNEKELTTQMHNTYPLLSPNIDIVMGKCNKALYMPVSSATERAIVLKELKALIH